MNEEEERPCRKKRKCSCSRVNSSIEPNGFHLGLKSLYVFDHSINGKSIGKKFLFLKKIEWINRETDRNAKLVVRMEGKSTFLTDPRLTRKFRLLSSVSFDYS